MTRIDFGHASEVFRSFTFKPHEAWLCFSLSSAGRTVDFAAAKESELADWFVGLSALLRGNRMPHGGLVGGAMSHGELMWHILQQKMGEELASRGFGGKIKAYAKKLAREKAMAASGEPGQLSFSRGVSFEDTT